MNLITKYATLTLKNPVMMASAGIGASADRMKRAGDAGVAAVVMKSLFENPIPRTGDPSPHMHVLRSQVGQLSAESFYSYEQASHLDEYGYAEEIARAKRSLEIPVIASLDCRTPEVWVKYARLMEQAGADAVEVKMCPHGENQGNAGLPEIVQLVKAAVKIPVVGKLLPQLDNPTGMYDAAADAGADGIVMFNRMSGLDIDTETMMPVMHGGIAGYGGAWYKHFCMRWIAECFGRRNLPITGTGGVGSGTDVVKYLLAGAHSVEIATLIILEGYGVIPRVVQDIEAWMQRKQVASVTDVIGLAARSLKKLDQIDRSTMLLASIDKGKCIACGRCADCCFRQAIDPGDLSYAVNEKCEGCGLCPNVCLQSAISLHSR
ncbi:MAG: dihydroorotate dehydrogenase [Bacillota bacterium]|nr:dihydroorotate dehydrogenase [Bacillota bacterium]